MNSINASSKRVHHTHVTVTAMIESTRLAVTAVRMKSKLMSRALRLLLAIVTLLLVLLAYFSRTDVASVFVDHRKKVWSHVIREDQIRYVSE